MSTPLQLICGTLRCQRRTVCDFFFFFFFYIDIDVSYVLSTEESSSSELTIVSFVTFSGDTVTELCASAILKSSAEFEGLWEKKKSFFSIINNDLFFIPNS